MKKKYLGIVSLIYALIIIYTWFNSNLNNYLAPNMQICIKASSIVLLILGIISILNNKIKFRFKILDLVLLLPVLALFIINDSKLDLSLSINRSGFNRNKIKTDIKVEDIEEDYDFTNTYFDIDDSIYMELANYISYGEKATKFIGKTIRVRGFVQKYTSYIPEGFFTIGKYAVTCCIADSEYIGFFVKYDPDKIKSFNWYQIEGVLKQGKDKDGYNILYIDLVNIEEISSEEEYIYSCDNYNSCSKLEKYELDY